MIRVNHDLIGDTRHAYLIGIGGVGMSALARVLKHHGMLVSGSDKFESRRTQQLEQEGIRVYIGQRQSHAETADLVIYSSAISEDHIELRAAYESGRRVYHRAQILASLLNRAETSVAVTGTHGKTTTTGMLSYVLSESNPTCLIGGDILNLGTNTILGGSNLWVSEVDESDGSHELYAPNYCICTNLEVDHIDYYKDFKQLKKSFERFLENVKNPGLVIYSQEDAVLKKLVKGSSKPNASIGFDSGADFSANNIVMTAFGSAFDVSEFGLYSGRFQLAVPGQHNISNALGVIAIALHLGIDAEVIQNRLAEFRGTGRRLEVKYRSQELLIVDDYAHHPTEVRVSLAALKRMASHVTVVFQPHRYSRTRFFYKEFARALANADEIILTEVYSAGEKNTFHTGAGFIYDELKRAGHRDVKILPKEAIVDNLVNRNTADAVVGFLGAGNIGEVADELAGRVKDCAQA